jgi:Tfp pilus assembly PilM family ATPase
MAQRNQTSIGIDFDNYGIRMARLMAKAAGAGTLFIVDKLESVRGDFAKEESASEAMRQMRDKIAPSMGDAVVSCVSGKQVYAAQLQFRKLPDEEMQNALKFEIRRSLPFEVAGAAVEYQYLKPAEKKGDTATLIVTAVTNILLNRHLRILDKAGLKPAIVDVLPLAASNALWAAQNGSDATHLNVVLHVGPDACTLSIDGVDVMFYNRTIYFTASDLFGPKADPNLSDRERERRIGGLTEELVRSLSFYESNYRAGSFGSIHFIGSYLSEQLFEAVAAKTGMKTATVDLAHKLSPTSKAEAGEYDIAIALAMRGADA